MMDSKTTGIVAYITWIGLMVALVAGDREGAKFHLNQALVIWLAGLLAGIPCIGYGPSLESLAHVRDEYIEIDQLTKAYHGFYSILSQLTC